MIRLDNNLTKDNYLFRSCFLKNNFLKEYNKIYSDEKNKDKKCSIILIEEGELKNIETLTKIGKNHLNEKMKDYIHTAEYSLKNRDEFPSWQTDFEMSIILYRKFKIEANTAGLNISENDKKVLNLTEQYYNLTKENSFPIECSEVNKRTLARVK